MLALLAVVAALLPARCLSHEGSTQSPFLYHSVQSSDIYGRLPRVAIVGAGPSGSSAAFFLRDLGARNASLACTVELFERSDYIGGRSTIVPLPGDDENAYAELGASIFVEANKNLFKAVEHFNLSLQAGHGGGSLEEKGGVALFGGALPWLYEEVAGSWGVWNYAKLFWTYGRAPLLVRSRIRAIVADFLVNYTPAFQIRGPFDTPKAFAKALGFDKLIGISVAQHLLAEGVYERFTDDFVGAAVRVNYGQTPASIHALEGLVALAAEGASSVVGGNRQIFERFVSASGARLHLQTPVDELIQLDNGKGWLIPGQGIFDVVLIACPFHSSGIRITADTVAHVPPQDYVQLHVTIVVTTASAPKGDFFGAEMDDKPAPRTVLSSFAATEAGRSPRPRINSVNYLRTVGDDAFAVKVFSEHEATDELLDDLFGLDTVRWVHRKVWQAYPRAAPMAVDSLPPFELAPGLYYANAAEPLISCMETATIYSWNVINLITLRLFGWRSSESWAESA